MHKSAEICEYLAQTPWAVDSFDAVRFLAAGEYNENYIVFSERPVVFRINHGSQLGLGNEQIEYEFSVLTALKDSGVTPCPYHVNPHAPLLGPVLIMEYLAGRSLNYANDTKTAAGIFARIHSQPPSEALITQVDPVRDIADESLGLINRFSDHPMSKERDHLLRYHEQILRLGSDTVGEFSDESLCIVNTEVNSGNFVIGEEQSWLVDWEKAVVSCRYQDLGHFLVPTTTLWKTDHRIDSHERLAFLKAYLSESNCGLDLETLSHRTTILEQTILLRALSWCYMAWYEYTQLGRVLTNDHTFGRIKRYLDEIKCFLK